MRYRIGNKEKVKETQKNYRIKNVDRIKKYHEENKLKIRGKHKKHITNKRKRFSEYKSNLGCKVCGYNKCSSALDFHHISKESKIIDVSRLYNSRWDIFIYETKKCIVICRNCHAELHYNQKQDII